MKIAPVVQSYADYSQSILQQVPVGITIFRGADMVVEMANETYLQIVDRKEADFVGRQLYQSLPEVKIFVEGLLTNVYNTGVPYYGNEFQVTLNRYGRQDVAYFNFVYQPLKEASGKIVGIIVVANEVTSLVLAKHKLAESERQFRNLVIQSPIAMSIFRGEEMVIEVANKVMLQNLWNRREDEVIGKPLLGVFPELKQQKFPGLLNLVYKSGEPHTEKEALAYVQRDDGLKTFYLDFEYAPLKQADGSVFGVMVTVNDVTEKVETRKLIEDAEERTRLATEAAELGIYEINLETDEWITTPRLAAIFGLPYPSPRNKYVEALHPDDVKPREEAYKKAYESGYLNYEARVIYKDGSVHWLRIKGRVYFDSKGKPVRQTGIGQDITEQKQFEEELARLVKERTHELENKNFELQRSNANLEEFAYAASHDLKEPVRKINFFTDRLKQDFSQRFSQEDLHMLDRIETAAQRMQILIEDLLMYSSISNHPYQLEEVDLNLKVGKVMDDLEIEIQQKKAVIEVGTLPVIKGVRRQLQQLFQNLLSNALKYSKENETPRIWINSSEVKGRDIPAFVSEDEMNKTYYCISVRDNGIGFDQGQAERIFLMFQRLHGRAEYPGTGIGLSIAKKVVENHKGKIIARGMPGEGAIFNIYLPKEQA